MLDKQYTLFLRYKTEVFPFQNNPKNLDLSYKMDLDFSGLFRKGLTVLLQNFIGLI